MSPKNTSRGETKLWKDHLDLARVRAMAEALAGVYPRFDVEQYVAAALRARFETRELKERIKLLASLLPEFLPKDYRRAVDILIAAAPGLPIFENWTFTSYVEQFGLEHFEVSVNAMRELTRHGTCEFAIRPYIIRYPDKMVPILEAWTGDPNDHVRRLAAEGSRPRGVWTMHIEAFRKNPRPVLRILEPLKADPSLYVRKAVANNLNDISKDHPGLLLKTAVRWMKDKNPYTNWILKHACRSLIRQGVPEVFPLFGFTPSAQLGKVTLATSKRRVAIGGEFTLTCRLVSRAARSQKLAIDYKVHYVKASGRTLPKLFKWSERSLRPGESVELTTRHSFAERSTRRHFPGQHLVELIVNGQTLAATSFDLVRR